MGEKGRGQMNKRMREGGIKESGIMEGYRERSKGKGW